MRRLQTFLFCFLAVLLSACSELTSTTGARAKVTPYGIDPAQAGAWPNARDDLEFFLHGTMSSEFVPERVLKAFVAAYPDLYPGGSFSAYGTIVEPGDDLPIGFTRRKVAHLGGELSIGINCAVCHVAELRDAPDHSPIRVIGRPSQFNIYAFFGAFSVAMARTAEPEAMMKFLPHYLRAGDADEGAQKRLAAEIDRQKTAIAAAINADPFASKSLPAGALHDIAPSDLELDGKRLERSMDLVPLVTAILKLFHNSRAALHIPEQLPPPVPTLPGPGRTDAFGVLAASFFGTQTLFDAPVKFGFAWNLSGRKWVHWDGNNNDPLARNLGAALGLGAPLVGQGKLVDLAAIERHTSLSERVRSPRYPWAVDGESAARGKAHYQARCSSCHDVPEDRRLFSIAEVGTDPKRATFFDAKQADLLNKWVEGLKVPGYRPPKVSFRSTGKYWATDLAGVWARSPYLHNGSVRSMWALLTPPPARPRAFRIGSAVYDLNDMGYADEGSFTLDTSLPGNSSSGHDYGTDLAEAAKRDLMEYLKTL
jgi:cytochrome c5